MVCVAHINRITTIFPQILDRRSYIAMRGKYQQLMGISHLADNVWYKLTNISRYRFDRVYRCVIKPIYKPRSDP